MKFIKTVSWVFCISLLPLAQGQPQDEQHRIFSLIAKSDSLLYDQPNQSLLLAQEAHSIASKQKDDSLIALALNRIGSAHRSLGDQMKALEHIQASLQISELENFKKILAKNMGDIGDIYAASGLDLDAIGYYKSELEILQKSNKDTTRLFTINNSIVRTFLDLNHLDSARIYLDAVANYLTPKLRHLHPLYLINLAEFSLQQGNVETADSLTHRALAIAKEFHSQYGIISANKLLSELYLGSKDFPKALSYGKKAYDMAQKSGSKELIYRTSNTLSKCYGALGQYEEAYAKKTVYETYLDSVQSIASVNELELLAYYQRLFRLRVLESKNSLNEQLAEQRRWIIYGLIVVLMVAALLITVIFYVVMKMRKQKRELEKLNAFKTKIFAIVSHDLKSPIESVSSTIRMFQEKLISKEEIEPLLPEVKEKTSNLMNLLNNIFLWAEGQMEGDDLKKENFPIDELLEELKEELSDRLESKKMSLKFASEEMDYLHSNRGVTRILLRNFIVNAIKFSDKGSEIQVRFYWKGNMQVMEVADQGVGMTDEIRENLFSEGLTSTIGTEGESGNGLGLVLCNDFVKGLGGTIEVTSELGKGSVFRVMLPL